MNTDVFVGQMSKFLSILFPSKCVSRNMPIVSEIIMNFHETSMLTEISWVTNHHSNVRSFNIIACQLFGWWTELFSPIVTMHFVSAGSSVGLLESPARGSTIVHRAQGVSCSAVPQAHTHHEITVSSYQSLKISGQFTVHMISINYFFCTHFLAFF